VLGNIGFPSLILIVVTGLIIFGPSKLPEMGKSVGRALNEFKKATKDIMNEDDQSKQ